ncbi:MAG: cytochrome c peroxidase [Deltaproteobacteria bacterium]|nr:cytochrome c peroxidase [Deltaproteobacteria bacterium]
MKKLVLLLVVLGLVALAFPLINLAVGSGAGVHFGEGSGGTPEYQAAMAVLAQKCGDCHAAEGSRPFYASFPVASAMIAEHVEEALEHYDMSALLAGSPTQAVDEVALARLQLTLEYGPTMPPPSYTLLHWDASFSEADRELVMKWVRAERAARHAAPGVAEALRGELLRPIPTPEVKDPAKVALGRKLYHDVRLSKDDTISCASCHDLAKGGTDQAPVSTGVDGQKGGINSPTVFNAALNLAQFWDGRAADLKAQADGPPNNPVEMATSWPEIIGKLEQDEALKGEFVAVYPEGFSGASITDAIAAFEETLLTPNSDFDRFLGGDAGALSAEAKGGHALFLELGCASCHVGEALGGQSYEKMGKKRDYFGHRGDVGPADEGRAAFTKNPADRHRFKVPTLRNVALTAPYFHDASAKTLDDAVAAMASFQLGEDLPAEKQAKLVAFLQSLTGELDGKKLE